MFSTNDDETFVPDFPCKNTGFIPYFFQCQPSSLLNLVFPSERAVEAVVYAVVAKIYRGKRNDTVIVDTFLYLARHLKHFFPQLFIFYIQKSRCFIRLQCFHSKGLLEDGPDLLRFRVPVFFEFFPYLIVVYKILSIYHVPCNFIFFYNIFHPVFL